MPGADWARTRPILKTASSLMASLSHFVARRSSSGVGLAACAIFATACAIFLEARRRVSSFLSVEAQGFPTRAHCSSHIFQNYCLLCRSRFRDSVRVQALDGRLAESRNKIGLALYVSQRPEYLVVIILDLPLAQRCEITELYSGEIGLTISGFRNVFGQPTSWLPQREINLTISGFRHVLDRPFPWLLTRFRSTFLLASH